MTIQMEQELAEIKRDIKFIKHKSVEKIPEHFSKQDAVNAFFGALFLGLTFLFKGSLISVGVQLTWDNILVIVTSTLFILSTQIYFIGYKRVKNMEERPFGQFLFKRLFTVYGIALTVSFFLLYIFGFLALVGTLENLGKLTLILSMPCSIGAAVGELLKKY